MSSSESSDSQSSSSEEELIREFKNVTKFGLVSKPRYKGESSCKSKKSNNTLETSSSFDRDEMANPANLSLTAEQLSNLLKISNAANTADKLPTSRGRARESDPPFEERNSFATHVNL